MVGQRRGRRPSIERAFDHSVIMDDDTIYVTCVYKHTCMQSDINMPTCMCTRCTYIEAVMCCHKQ